MVFIYLELLISKEGRLWLYKKRCAVGLIFVPKIEGNSQYEEIKKWVENGGNIEAE